jgi:hypothetical protein
MVRSAEKAAPDDRDEDAIVWLQENGVTVINKDHIHFLFFFRICSICKVWGSVGLCV